MIKESELKFYPDGRAKDYLGNTIISFLNSELYNIYRESIKVMEALKNTELAQSYAFLPPSSFHVTILTLCREMDRGTPYWPRICSPEEEFIQIDKKLKETVEQIPKPQGIKMEVDCCLPINIRLKPASAHDEQKIRDYRDRVSEAVGIRHAGHDEFAFHLTYSYQLYELSHQEQAMAQAFCRHYTEVLRKKVAPFELPEPEFVIFNNMLEYEPDLSRRKL
ncbi:DUF1868 domain-containing protein [Paenibacillus sanguinis]|uniref:DUF1868 domain-containing protein n=1 Tax=Paenibacillus sanguinis TaxID=225906 RepID=UPI00035D553A|nr:DUF1868 domain-containing protein [Paenibacillus sanguinis]